MFVAPGIIRKNIASRKWPSLSPRGEKFFRLSRAIEISFLQDERLLMLGARTPSSALACEARA
jgi:hypothetical protein